MKKILIPIDFKFNNYEAIDYVINFFKSEACEFFFINTYTYKIDALNALSILQADDERFKKPKLDSENNLGVIIQKYASNNENENHQFYALSECADLIQGMKRAIREIKIDLVILTWKNDPNIPSEKYSRNTKRIIENIRECPVMVIPSSAKLRKKPKFVLVSNFVEEVPKAELKNWFELVKTARGSLKIVTLSGRDKMTEVQKINQNRVRFNLEIFSESSLEIAYVDTAKELKEYARNNSDNVICLIDRKPDFWRIFGITQSQINSLGPLRNTPLIALHN